MKKSKNDRRIDYIEFRVRDIAKTKAFYGSVFGWRFKDYGPAYCEFQDGRTDMSWPSGARKPPEFPIPFTESRVRKIINSTCITIDGAVEDPHLWPSSGDSQGQADVIQTDLLENCDAMLTGRRTTMRFASVWPTRSGDRYSDRITAMPKFVASSTLRNPTASLNMSRMRDRVDGARVAAATSSKARAAMSLSALLKHSCRGRDGGHLLRGA